MKIGIDARFYGRGTGGVGRYTKGLIRELGRIDQENEYAVFLLPEDMKEWEEPGENFRAVKAPYGYYSLDEQRAFPKLIKKYKLDLIHYTMFNHPVMCRIPFVVTIHDLTMTLFPVGRKQKSLIRKLAYNYVMKHAARASRKVIVPSEATKKDVIEILGAPKEKVVVTYEGVDETYGFHTGEKIQDEIKKQYGIKKPFILFVSQWRPHKGIMQLVEAYKLLRQKYDNDIELVLCGKPNESFPEIIQAVERAKEEVGGVITPGFVPEEDLPALYQAAEAFVFPSYYEGFGLGPLEAMASGCPVASSNTSCMPEILQDAAVYFNPKDAHDIARVVEKVLNDLVLRKNLIAMGRIQVEKYTWRKMARETLQIYRRINL